MFIQLLNALTFGNSKSKFKALINTQWGCIGKQNGMYIMHMDKLPMCDWDLATKKTNYHYTISTIEQVVNILENRVLSHPDEKWVAYKTPNGVHAFLVSHKKAPWKMAATLLKMKCDRLYVYYAIKRNTYACRVSPKPWRKEDFVASYWRDFGYGKILPEHIEVMKRHDSCIKGDTRFI